MVMKSINPATEEVIETFESHGDDDIERALVEAERGQRALGEMGLAARLKHLGQVADILERRSGELGEIMTKEMGKPLAQAKAEARKCASACRYYVERGEELMKDKTYDIDDGQAYQRTLPIGPVLAVMPWNFPLWQVFRFVAPAMTIGNPGLLKHASNVPRSALEIEAVMREAGFPEGAFRTLLIGSDKVEGILRDRRVRGATVTGSNPAGSAVAKVCGELIKPTVLELGGSDAFLVQPSADLDMAVETAVKGRTQNNGQSCIAAKRFIVHDDIYEDFRDRMAAKFEALTIGDPMADGTDIGPLSSAGGRDDVDEQVQKSLSEGARAVVRPGRCEDEHGGKGYWYRPGIIEDIPEGSPAAKEEIFGPVAMLFRAKNIDDAIRIANDHHYGLGSAICTTDKGDLEAAVNGLEAGMTAVNRIVASDPRLPFGGVKDSGYGRELAEEGLMAFANLKTVTVSGM